MNSFHFTNPEDIINSLEVRKGMIVADFGAGTGAYVMLLAMRVGAMGRVYAVEVQKDFLTTIKNTAVELGLENIEVIWGDIEKRGGTKIKDHYVDLVIISNTLFQAEDKKGLLGEAKRILKVGGQLLIIDWSDSFNNLGPTPVMIVSAKTTRALCGVEGFIYKKEIPVGDHHYGLIFLKI